MSVQITIIGLGQIGASIGLALADHKELILRVGHDLDMRIARQAEKIRAVDKHEKNLPSAVRKADLVILALPMNKVRGTLEIIAADLKEGAVVMDTAPVKEIVAKWSLELLPDERNYIGLTPVINPAYLHEFDLGINAARADLFQGGLIAIASSSATSSNAIKLAADLTRLLGSSPFFVDPLEIDGLMAGTYILPQLMAAALLNATVDQPGWREGRKVAGRAYTEATEPIVHPYEIETMRTSAMFNRQNVLRTMDSLIASLQMIRNDIEQEDDKALDECLKRARQGREDWWRQRLSSDWVGEQPPEVYIPKSSDWFGRLIGKKPKG
jgi:prephenate dehydrogenase